MSSLVEFFTQNRRFLNHPTKILLACSGGPDSVALAYALKEIQPQLCCEVEMAHINHRLRGAESEADAQFVRSLAKKLGWRYHVALCPVRPLRRGNLEEVARDKRYAALERIALRRQCDVIFTAHTLDDQVETVMMNLMRGTGPDGLSGIAPCRRMENSKVWLCRPLLGVEKTELLRWIARWRGQFRKDRSNDDHTLVRNWVRKKLVPLLNKKAPGFKVRIGRLAEIAFDEKAHWEQEISRLEAGLFRPFRGGRLLDLKGLLRYSSAVQRRILRRSLGRDLMTYEAVERLREWMQAPPTGARLWQLRKGWSVERLSKSKGSPSARLYWFKHSKPGKG